MITKENAKDLTQQKSKSAGNLTFAWQCLRTFPRALAESATLGLFTGLSAYAWTEDQSTSCKAAMTTGLGWLSLRLTTNAQRIKYANLPAILRAKNPPWDNKAAMQPLEKLLETGSIIDSMDMRNYLPLKNKIARFAGEVYLVLLDNGAKAVWKPRRKDLQCAHAEVAAYQASLWLQKSTGRHLVPPTVMKEYQGQTGSLQWFVESEIDLWVDEQRERAYRELPPEDLANGAAFVHTFGQWDLHPGNEIMTSTSNKDGQVILALIDNEGISNRKYSRSITERPFVQIAYNDRYSGNFEEPPTFQTLRTPTQDYVKAKLKDFKLTAESINCIYDNIVEKGKRDFTFMNWRGSLRVQYHQNNPKAFPNHVQHYPDWVTSPYETLTMSDLKNIFAIGIQHFPKHYNDNFFNDILERRHQLLSFAKQCQHNPGNAPPDPRRVKI